MLDTGAHHNTLVDHTSTVRRVTGLLQEILERLEV